MKYSADDKHVVNQEINLEGRQKLAIHRSLTATKFTQVGIPLALHSPNRIPLGLSVTNKVKFFQLSFGPYLNQLEIRVLEMNISHLSTTIRESFLSIGEDQ